MVWTWRVDYGIKIMRDWYNKLLDVDIENDCESYCYLEWYKDLSIYE